MDHTEFLRIVQAHGHVLEARKRRGMPLTRYRWEQLQATPEVARPFRGVLSLPTSAAPSLQRIRTAAAAINANVVVTGWSAAYLLGLRPVAPTEVHLLIRHGASPTRRPGLRLTETVAFPPAQSQLLRHGLAVAPVARVLADIAPSATADTLLDLAIDARFAGLLDPNDLAALLAQRARFPGRRRIRDVHDAMTDDGSDSGFEFRARDQFIAHGLIPVAQQHPVRVGADTRLIDLLFAGNVGVECVGFAFHSGRRAFDGDADRRNDLAEIEGILIYELTWTTFHKRWPTFVERVARSVASRHNA